MNPIEPLTPSEMMRLLGDVIALERSIKWGDFRARGGRQHTRDACRASRKAGAPKNCVIHNPSNHKMRYWPMILRASGLIERQCPHGVGHPDPDSAAYLDWLTGSANSHGVHGCDVQDGRSCCSQPECGPHKAEPDKDCLCSVCQYGVYAVKGETHLDSIDIEWRHLPR